MAGFYHSYLFAYVFWVCLTLGCFGMTVLHHTLRGSWGLPVLRLWEAGSKNLWLMLLLFIPVIMGLHDIYPWAKPELVQHDPILQHKALWLNPNLFTIRALIYFAIWLLISTLLNKWSLDQDRTGDINLRAKRTNLASPSIVIYVVTITFAFTDWVMSIDAHWSSTMFGFWFTDTQALLATAFVTAIVTWSAINNRRPYSEVVTPQLTRDLGNLFLTMTMIWGYFTVSQFLIVWSGNLPEEIAYFLKRMHGTWNYLGTFLVTMQFFGPFLVLLPGKTKRSPKLMFQVAVWFLVMRLIDYFWAVMPAFRLEGISVTLWDVVLFLGMGAIWLGIFYWNLKKVPLLPTHDPRLQVQEVMEHA